MRPKPRHRRNVIFSGWPLGAAATVVTLALIGAGTIVAVGAAMAATWPTPKGELKTTKTIAVPTLFNGDLKRYFGIGDGSSNESQDPMFVLDDGATLENVILGAPAGDGVHCKGSCTLRNVWWEDVGEDAATFKGTTAAKYSVIGGGAKKAQDKVFQHNGGGTLTIEGFVVEDFGKLYRSCGNCKTQHQRHVIIKNVIATAPGGAIAGINSNYGDTATLSAITIVGDSKKKVVLCQKFQGNATGAEPTKIGSGPDGTNCRYSPSDLTYR